MNSGIQELLEVNFSSLCLLVGNGINRYCNDQQTESWEQLLRKLWDQNASGPMQAMPNGITLTEFYDALDLSREKHLNGRRSLQKQFCDLLKEWKPTQSHHDLVKWASQNDVPLLTTNFESTFAEAAKAKLYRLGDDGFTDYYPWSSYYAPLEIDGPSTSFAIWHINGMAKYRRSIRLGLSHYMGSVHRARDWIHRSGRLRLFNGNSHDSWKGKNTWLHCLFNCDLLIIGFGLYQDEVFLRWLLVERAKYFKKFPDRRRVGWYLYVEDQEQDGRNLLLRSVGITPLRVDEYSQMYQPFALAHRPANDTHL